MKDKIDTQGWKFALISLLIGALVIAVGLIYNCFLQSL